MSTIVINPYIHGGGDKWWEAGGATGAYAAYQAKNAASLSGSYADLTGNGRDFPSQIQPPTLGANGWSLNGTNQYLVTGITQTSPLWTILVIFTNGSFSPINQDLIGANAFGNIQVLRPIGGSSTRRYRNGTVALSNAGQAYSGVMGYSGNVAYLDGVSDGTIPSIGGLSGIEFYIGASNSSGSPSDFIACDIGAVVVWDENNIPTPAQIAAVSVAMAAL